MKTKPFKIQIPEPCHEDWNQMTAKDQGAFCKSCAKTVVDFTKMSDRELVDYLKKNKAQKTCGRFNNYQLDRNIVASVPTPNYKIQFRKFLTGLFFGLSFPALAKAGFYIKKEKPSYFTTNADLSEKLVLKGVVQSESGKVLENVNIRLYQNGRMTETYFRTGKDGTFTFEIQKTQLDKNLSLKIAAPLYQEEIFMIEGLDQIKVVLQLVAKDKHAVMGKMAMTNPIKPPVCSEAADESSMEMGQALITTLGNVAVQKTSSQSYYPEVIEGVVLDEQGEGVSFAHIYIPELDKSTMTDVDGNYKLDLNVTAQQAQLLHLQVNALGYQKHEIVLENIDEGKETITLAPIVLDSDVVLVGFIIQVPEPIQAKPGSFDSNYSEPAWKEKGFSTKKEYLQHMKMNNGNKP